MLIWNKIINASHFSNKRWMINREAHKEVITIGFFTKENNDFEKFKRSFDIVCEEDDDYNDLMKIIFLDKNN